MSPISDRTPVTGLVSKAGSGLRRPADFAGKKVATPGINGSLHVTFMKWLKNGGVEPKAVTYIEMGFPQMNDMMRAGQVDGALLVEPFLRQSTETKAGDFVAYTPVEVMNNRMEVFYAMSAKFVADNPAAAAAFKEAIREGHAFIAKNEARARMAQVQYLKLPEPVARTIPLPTFQADISAADVQAWIDMCREFGITRGTATVKQVLWQP
jgi:NitT/TauT family transport system substrate-binding protein